MFQGCFRVASMLCQEYFKGSSWKIQGGSNKVVSVVQGYLMGKQEYLKKGSLYVAWHSSQQPEQKGGLVFEYV